jgi:hypothetical protein
MCHWTSEPTESSRASVRARSRGRVSGFAEVIRLPVVARCAVSGSLIGTVAGGLIGVVLGIRANPATAWFAVFEAGLPGGVVGGTVGSLIGLAVWVYRKALRSSRT